MERKYYYIIFTILIVIILSFAINKSGSLFGKNEVTPNNIISESSINTSFIKESPQRVEVQCNETYYKVAFIILETRGDKATEEEIEAVNRIKKKVSERFSDKTLGLATMDTTYSVTVLEVDEGTDLWDYYGAVNVSNLFYKSNPDEFDFLAVYIAYDSPGNMHFIGVSNYIGGIGKLKSGFGIGYLSQYGSKGKLLGIANLREVEYNIDPEYDVAVVNGVLHEVGHYWGVYIDFMSKPNGNSYAHWSRLLNMSGSVMKGRTWEDNQNGNFTRVYGEDFIHGYTDFDLYLMGLLPSEKVKPIFKIITNNSIESTTVGGYAEEITVQDIVNEYGKRKCFICNGSKRC